MRSVFFNSEITRSWGCCILRSQDHEFSKFRDHKITNFLLLEITGSWVMLISRSQDHGFFSCWDHGITCFFVLDHKKSRHTDHKIIGISKIKIIRSQYFFDPEKLDHKIMDHKYDPQFYDLIFDFTTVIYFRKLHFFDHFAIEMQFFSVCSYSLV